MGSKVTTLTQGTVKGFGQLWDRIPGNKFNRNQ